MIQLTRANEQDLFTGVTKFADDLKILEAFSIGRTSFNSARSSGMVPPTAVGAIEKLTLDTVRCGLEALVKSRIGTFNAKFRIKNQERVLDGFHDRLSELARLFQFNISSLQLLLDQLALGDLGFEARIQRLRKLP